MEAKASKEQEQKQAATVKAPTVVLLDPKKVKVGWRAREDDGDIGELAESIKRIGQLHPIVVRFDKTNAPVIIAGLRRLRACRKLGIPVKATSIKPEDELATLTVQLEENVARKDFDKLEVGSGLKRYKELYEKKHGLGHGWNLKKAIRDEKGHAKGAARPAEDFVKQAARTLGISSASVYDLLGIANLPDADRKEIAKAKTTRERNVAASKALSKVRKQKKEKALEKQARVKEKARAKEAKAKGKKPGAEPRLYVYEGDYRKVIKVKDVAEQLKGKVDLLFTDPMYDLERNPILHTGRTSINEASLAKWDKLDISWVLDAAPLLSDTGTLLAFCPLELIGLYKLVCLRAKLRYRTAIIWHKTNPGAAHRDVEMPACEALIRATKGDKCIFHPHKNAGSVEAHNHVEGPICGGNERLSHPFQKPLWLVEKLMARYTDKAALVFDPFMGSGTTLVAASKLGLRAVGVELESKYVKQAKTRLAAL